MYLQHNGFMDSQDLGRPGVDIGFDGEYGYCTLPDGAKILGMSYLTLREWVLAGKVKAKRFGRNWLLPLDPNGYPQVIDGGEFPFVPVPPVGYLPLPEAAEARGMSRQRLYQFVKQGRLPGCVRSKGTALGLVIWVPPGPILPPQPTDNPVLTTGDTVTLSEAAKIAGLSRKHMYELLYAGRVKGAQHFGRSWVIPRDFEILTDQKESKKIPEDWVDMDTAAEQYGVSRRTLGEAARSGLVEARRVGQRWYFAPYSGPKTNLLGIRRQHGRWLTAEEAAEERGVTDEWLREQARRGDIEAKKIGMNWYFPPIAQAKPAQRHGTGTAPRGWVDSETAAEQRGMTRQQLQIEARMGLLEAQKLGGRWYFPPIDKPEIGE